MNNENESLQGKNDYLKIDQKNEKRRKAKKRLTQVGIAVVASALLVLFGLEWQDSSDLLAVCNSFYFSGFILLIVGWMILMVNQNIFAPLVFGMKSFFLMFAAKKPKQDYYSYLEEHRSNPISSQFYVVPFLAAIPNIIVAVVLHLVFENILHF